MKLEVKIYFLVIIIRLTFRTSTGAIHFNSRTNFLHTHPCVLIAHGKKTIGKHSLWTQLCKHRRSWLDLETLQMISRERGPARDPKGYYPTYGFAPYWEFGDWVFDKIKYGKDDVRMCGKKCPLHHINFGRICAVNNQMNMKTYDNYCELKNYNCDHQEDWSMAYRGKCIGVALPVPTDPSDLQARAQNFVAAFSKQSAPTAP